MQWLVGFICLSLTFACTLAADGGEDFTPHRGRYCGTSEPGATFKALQRQLGSIESQARMSGAGNLEDLTPIEIETWFHIVTTKANADLVTDKMISDQVSLHLPKNLLLMRITMTLNQKTHKKSSPTYKNHTPTRPSHTNSSESTTPSTTPGRRTATTSE